MEFYSFIKKNEIMSFAGEWMKPENTKPSETSQTQKIKGYIFFLYVDARKKKEKEKVGISWKHLQLKKNKKTNALIKTRADDVNGHLSKEEQMDKKHIKKYATSMVTREMQIKATIRH